MLFSRQVLHAAWYKAKQLGGMVVRRFNMARGDEREMFFEVSDAVIWCGAVHVPFASPHFPRDR